MRRMTGHDKFINDGEKRMKRNTGKFIRVGTCTLAFVTVFTVVAVFTVLMLLAGCKERIDRIPTDSMPEEVVETLLENYIESKLDLTDDELKGKIDLTFWDGEEEKEKD